MLRITLKTFFFLLAGVVVASGARAEVAQPAGSFLSPEELVQMRQQHGETLVIVDARSADDYAQGHIPGAISLPPERWRTGKYEPEQGPSQFMFRMAEESDPAYGEAPVDVARYERMLGEAGIGNDDIVVVYGNHAGKSTSTVPVMILRMLGHEQAYFLDGIGVNQWTQAGHELTTTEPAPRPTTSYTARFNPNLLWTLRDVQNAQANGSAQFYDTRDLPEWTGEERRGNARVGHMPGAKRLDYAELMGEDHCTLSQAQLAKLHEQMGFDRERPIVLYCQTSTRVSLPYLVLKDLGYDNVVVYDGSWHEYGNREDTAVVESAPAQPH